VITAAWRRGCGVAGRGAGAAAHDAGDRGHAPSKLSLQTIGLLLGSIQNGEHFTSLIPQIEHLSNLRRVDIRPLRRLEDWAAAVRVSRLTSFHIDRDRQTAVAPTGLGLRNPGR
jgi:hypothetical protein